MCPIAMLPTPGTRIIGRIAIRLLTACIAGAVAGGMRTAAAQAVRVSMDAVFASYDLTTTP